MDQKMYEISLPDRPGEFRIVGDPLSREEALAYVQEYYGADDDGRVSLINPLPDAVKEEEVA